MRSSKQSIVQKLRSKRHVRFSTIIIIASFFISRLVYYCAGIRFDTWDESGTMQLVSTELLRTDLWRSIVYLHSQPPLFNLFVGLIGKTFPAADAIIYAFIYLFLGLVLSLSMFWLMTDLRVPEKTGLILTLIFIFSPACILFENILYYTYPVAVLLSLSAVILFRFVKTGKMIYGALFFTILSFIVLSRSLFHLVWLIAIVLFLFLILKDLRKTVALTSVLPLALVLSVYCKNACLFGHFSLSTWLGGSFAKVSTFMLNEDERLALAEEGSISELAFIPPIQGLWVYYDKARVPAFEKTDIPVLDREYWSSSGINFNNLSFTSLSDRYFADAITVIKKHPGAYIRGLKRSFTICFFPASDWFITRKTGNRDRFGTLAAVYDKVVYGRFAGGNIAHLSGGIDDYRTHIGNPWNAGILIVIWYCIALISAFITIVRDYRKHSSPTPFSVVLAFMVLTVVYVLIVGNFTEVNENERFRFITEPLIVILLSIPVGNFIRLITHRSNG